METSKVDDNEKEPFWNKFKKVTNISFILLALATLVMICIAAATYDTVGFIEKLKHPSMNDTVEESQNTTFEGGSQNKTLEKCQCQNESVEESQENKTVVEKCQCQIKTDDECSLRTPGVLYGCPSLKYGMLITLDNGPSVNTEKILKTLHLTNITALFFLTSSNMILYSNTVKEIKRRGHEIGFLLTDKRECLEQIKEGENVLKKITGYGKGRFVRFNAGSVDKVALNIITNYGYKLVLWNAATHRIDSDPVYDSKLAESSLAYIPENGAILSLSETSKITVLLLENIWNEMKHGREVWRRFLAGPFLTPKDCFDD